MTQLILNNTIVLPETSADKYRCYPAQLTQSIDMISGRRVDMGNDLLRQVLAVLRGQTSFAVSYLSDETDTLRTGTFLTEAITQPAFAFSKAGLPYWHNFGFTLREVTPHD